MHYFINKKYLFLTIFILFYNFTDKMKKLLGQYTKKNICLFDSQMQKFHKTGVACRQAPAYQLIKS